MHRSIPSANIPQATPGVLHLLLAQAFPVGGGGGNLGFLPIFQAQGYI